MPSFFMADVNIGASIQIDTGQAVPQIKKTREEVSTLKTQLKEATVELQRAQDKFGTLSKEAVSAAKKVATVKDAIREATEVADLFDPGAKFQTLTGVAASVASGFSAVQGAMALAGADSEKVEEAILKVQAAMAIADGLSVISDSAKNFQRLGLMIQQSTIFQKMNNAATVAAAAVQKLFAGSVTMTSTSFKVLKTAIVATGIGALLVGIGFLISKLTSFSNASKEAAEKQRELTEAMQDADEAALNAGLTFIKREQQLDIAKAKARGASAAELQALEQKHYDERIEQQQKFLGKTKDKLAIENAIADEQIAKEVNQLNFTTEQRKKAEEDRKRISDKSSADAKQKAEERKKQREQELQEAQKMNEALAKENAVSGAGGEKNQELVKLQQDFDEKLEVIRKAGESELQLQTWFQIQKAAIINKYEQEDAAKRIADLAVQEEAEVARKAKVLQSIETEVNNQREALSTIISDQTLGIEERNRILDQGERSLRENTRMSEDQRFVMEANFTNARIQLAEMEAKAKTDAYQSIGGALGALSQLIGQQTAAGKALAIAQAGINTWVGVTEVLKTKSVLPEPLATISRIANIAAVVASGLGAIKNIMKVQVPGGGGGGSAGAISGLQQAAPLQLAAASSTFLDQNSINGIGNAAGNRAFVLDTDIQNNRERATRLARAARLG